MPPDKTKQLMAQDLYRQESAERLLPLRVTEQVSSDHGVGDVAAGD